MSGLDRLPGADALTRAVHNRNAVRILPLLVAGYVLNTLAKSNVGFAAIEMNKDLGFTPAVFGLGAGLFFVTYTLLEIPSNLLMRRFGARAWLSRILITWGAVAMAMAAIHGKWSLYALRLLLGAAEAGWYPGVIFYLTSWFPQAYRARAIMLFFLGAPFASVIGSPISGALLSIPPTLGLKGWQWLFVVEGAPSVLLGLFALKLLKNGPAEASWLSIDEKQALARSLDSDARGLAGDEAAPGRRFRADLVLFSVMNLASAMGLYGVSIWAPRVVKEVGGLSNLQTGFVVATPFLFSAVALAAAAYSSDRLHERRWHVFTMYAFAASALVALAFSHSPWLDLVLLTIAVSGAIGVQGVFFAMVSDALRRSGFTQTGLSAALAVVTSLGNVGGFVGPYLVGALLSITGTYAYSLVVMGLGFALAGLLALLHRPDAEVSAHPAERPAALRAST